MSTPTMKRILADTQALIQEKRAEYQSTVAGEDEKQAKGLDISGAGDDSPKTRGHALEADESALDPTKKPLDSDDAFVEPDNGGNGTPSQAKDPSGADDSEMTRGHALEADEAALEPTKKPLNSGEALEVKEADGPAKIANDILTDIRAYQEEQKTAAAPAEGEKLSRGNTTQRRLTMDTHEGEKAAADVDMTAVLKEAGLDDEQVAKVAAVLNPEKKADEAAEATPAADAKTAAGPNLELTTDVLAKIAAHILSTTEGADYVEQFLAKEAGAEECREILGFLSDQSDRAEKQAAFEAGAADAQALHEQAIYQVGVAEGQKTAEKVDVAPETEAEAQNEFFRKLGQAVADQSIQGLMGGAPGPDMGGGAVPPDALAGAEAAMPEEGGMAPPDAEMGAEGGDVTAEELMAALQELVAEGTISEEEAVQVLEYIGGEGAEAAPAEAAPAEAALAEAAPAEEAPPASGGEGDDGLEAEASAENTKVATLLTAIQAARNK